MSAYKSEDFQIIRLLIKFTAVFPGFIRSSFNTFSCLFNRVSGKEINQYYYCACSKRSKINPRTGGEGSKGE